MPDIIFPLKENKTYKREVTASTLSFFQTLQNSMAQSKIQDKIGISVEITAEGRPPWKFSSEKVNASAIWNAADYILTTCTVYKNAN